MTADTMRLTLDRGAVSRLQYGPFKSSLLARWRCHLFAKRARAKGWTALRMTTADGQVGVVCYYSPLPDGQPSHEEASKR